VNTLVFNLSLENYTQELERKNRLETKALGYLNFISIILAVVTAFYAVFLVSDYAKIKNGNEIYLILIHSVVIYILLASYISIIALLISLKVKIMSKYLYEEENYNKLRAKTDEEFEKTVSLNLIKYTNKNIVINNRTEKIIKIAYYLLNVILIAIGLLLFVLLLYVLKGGLYGY